MLITSVCHLTPFAQQICDAKVDQSMTTMMQAHASMSLGCADTDRNRSSLTRGHWGRCNHNIQREPPRGWIPGT
jgi:hypothetical protein